MNMKARITMVLALLVGVVSAQEQPEDSVRTNAFIDQLSRTPYLQFEEANNTGFEAFQDSIDGIFKYFWKDYSEDNKIESFSYYYDFEGVLYGGLDKDLIRDWNSIDLDSMYAHDFIWQDENVGDSLRTDIRKTYGFGWNESYNNGKGYNVNSEDLVLKLDTLDETPYFAIHYWKDLYDTSYVEPSQLYDPYELNEKEMYGVLRGFDLSGEWTGYVDNVVYDKNTLDPFTAYRQDSMISISWVPNSDTTQYTMVPIVDYVREHEFKSGGCSTELRMNEDSTWTVFASYEDPTWSDMAKLVWVDMDTLRYIIEVGQPALEAMEHGDLSESQGFAWIWNFCRQTALKEEE